MGGRPRPGGPASPSLHTCVQRASIPNAASAESVPRAEPPWICLAVMEQKEHWNKETQFNRSKGLFSITHIVHVNIRHNIHDLQRCHIILILCVVAVSRCPRSIVPATSERSRGREEGRPDPPPRLRRRRRPSAAEKAPSRSTYTQPQLGPFASVTSSVRSSSIGGKAETSSVFRLSKCASLPAIA